MGSEAIATAFAENQGLIWAQVHRFRKIFGRGLFELEELFQIGVVSFLEACHTWNPDHGKTSTGSRLSTWATHKIWYGLLQARRKELRECAVPEDSEYRTTRRGRVPLSPRIKEKRLTDPISLARYELVDLIDILQSLSGDAVFVTHLVLETPFDLCQAMRNDSNKTCGLASRQGIREYLMGCGWKFEQVMKAFREIKEALEL